MVTMIGIRSKFKYKFKYFKLHSIMSSSHAYNLQLFMVGMKLVHILWKMLDKQLESCANFSGRINEFQWALGTINSKSSKNRLFCKDT